MAVEKNPGDKVSRNSRRYSAIKYGVSAGAIVYDLLLMAGLVFSGISAQLAKAVNLLVGGNFLALPLYFFIICVFYYILTFPLNFYRNFILEHQFQLTRQSLAGWFKDQLKSAVLAYFIAFILLAAFYALIGRYPRDWWWMISVFWIFFSLVLAKLTPVVIIPLFFKYRKFSDQALRQRIISLAGKMKVKILDVFEIDLSCKTEKANAALVGFGSTRRVILGDTLQSKYSPEEIEVILAHEFAHQKLQHLLKLALAGALTTLLGSYLIYKTGFQVLRLCGLESFSDISALPLVFAYLILLRVFLGPWENFLSRRFESQADRLAIESSGLKEAFISTMEKLSAQNLADRDPHPLIKLFFFDHPPINDRIRLARSL